MSEKRPASEETVQAFIHAVYPESTELCMTANSEEDILREATRLILDRRAPDPEKQKLAEALRKTAYPGPFFNDDVRDARALLRRYEEKP